MNADRQALTILHGLGLHPKVVTNDTGTSLVLSRQGRRVSLHFEADGVVGGTVVDGDTIDAWDGLTLEGRCRRMVAEWEDR